MRWQELSPRNPEGWVLILGLPLADHVDLSEVQALSL